MILVDVEVMSLDRRYQFSLDEKAKVGGVLREIADILCQKHHCRLIGDIDKMVLCSKRRECILDKNLSLESQGIHNADRIMLV